MRQGRAVRMIVGAALLAAGVGVGCTSTASGPAPGADASCTPADASVSAFLSVDAGSPACQACIRNTCTSAINACSMNCECNRTALSAVDCIENLGGSASIGSLASCVQDLTGSNNADLEGLGVCLTSCESACATAPPDGCAPADATVTSYLDADAGACSACLQAQCATQVAQCSGDCTCNATVVTALRCVDGLGASTSISSATACVAPVLGAVDPDVLAVGECLVESCGATCGVQAPEAGTDAASRDGAPPATDATASAETGAGDATSPPDSATETEDAMSAGEAGADACVGTGVGSGYGGTCVPGSTQCAGSTASETCSSSGTWGAAVACSTSAPYCSVSNGACGPAPNVIFVTSASYTGDLGGLSGADADCAAAAQLAGLTGTFISYLSTSTTDASSRIASARGWVRTDGMPVADTAADLAAGSIWYPISLDENGNAVSPTTPGSTPNAATGSTSQGAYYSGQTCSDWTTSTGIYGSGVPWAGFSGFQQFFSGESCDLSFHLYCLQVSQNVQVSVNKVAGRYAFVQPWSPSSAGISAADSACQSAATSACLPGSYLSLLATTSASAASRFSTTGSAWVRPDGVPVFSTAANLDTMTVIAPIVLTAGGSYYGNYALWNGATSPTAVGTAATTCSNWTSNDGSLTASSAITGFTQLEPSGVADWAIETLTCSADYGVVYCLQE
jgi:hypothetical protein